MFLHEINPRGESGQKCALSYPALNVRRYKDPENGKIAREIVNDVFLFEKNDSGLWKKRIVIESPWNCVLVLPLPVFIEKGQIIDWQMVEI